MKKGWICPKCAMVHAPTTRSCDCDEYPAPFRKPRGIRRIRMGGWIVITQYGREINRIWSPDW